MTIAFDADEAGTYTITVNVDYLDDLNQVQTYTEVFTGEVTEAAQPQMPMRQIEPSTETTQDDDLVGRLLLGFLGLGG